ncbi:MAG: hypothetical protein ACLGHY_10845, partial [Gammaproteobacteria bacterium]
TEAVQHPVLSTDVYARQDAAASALIAKIIHANDASAPADTGAGEASEVPLDLAQPEADAAGAPGGDPGHSEHRGRADRADRVKHGDRREHADRGD